MDNLTSTSQTLNKIYTFVASNGSMEKKHGSWRSSFYHNEQSIIVYMEGRDKRLFIPSTIDVAWNINNGVYNGVFRLGTKEDVVNLWNSLNTI